MSTVDGARRPAGRPPDPRVEQEALRATLAVYAQRGWSGLTFDAVAREAKVGKGALYRRWPGREALLIDAFDRFMFPIAVDCGSFEADLEAFAMQWVSWYSDRARGLALMRIWADAQTQPELGRMYRETLLRPRRRAIAQMTARAVDRGQLADSATGDTVVDVLLGAMQIHWQFARHADQDRLEQRFIEYVKHLIDVLRVGAISEQDPTDDL
jgi:AcrR family transcriptional regulator